MSKKSGCKIGYKRVKGKCVPIRDGVWRKIEKNSWQRLSKKYDMNITKQKDDIYLDIFDAKIKNHDNAHMFSDVFPSVKEAKDEGSFKITHVYIVPRTPCCSGGALAPRQEGLHPSVARLKPSRYKQDGRGRT